LASQNGHIEVVKVLLNHSKVDPSANNNFGMISFDLNISVALRWALNNGHFEVIEVLIKNGININIIDRVSKFVKLSE
jgi:ankyrin repeat protein